MAAAPGGHRRRKPSGQRDRRAQVDFEHPVYLLLGQLGEPPAGRHAGARDEDVHLADLADQPVGLIPIRQVAGDRTRPELASQRLERPDSAARKYEARAPGREFPGDRIAEPARGARHQHAAADDAHGGECSCVPSRVDARLYLGNSANVAVKPCRKLRPPTGPISPAAKNPAEGAPPSSRWTIAAS